MIKMRVPKLLKEGATIAVVAPSEPLSAIAPENIEIGIKNLREMGFFIKFTPNVNIPLTHPQSAKLRAKDIMDMISSESVDCIMAAIGGYSSLEVLSYLDFNKIALVDKPFIGFSDITIFNMVFYKYANLINFYGPTFAIFCQKQLPEFTKRSFLEMLCSNSQCEVSFSKVYADDLWYTNNNGIREWKINKGWYGYNLSKFSGQIIGGNLETLLALAGTPYFPSDSENVLFLEEARGKSSIVIRREIQQLKLMGIISKVKALVFGRFWGWEQEEQEIFFAQLMENMLYDFSKPVIVNLDFGHSDPMLTIPIGGIMKFIDEKIFFEK